MLGVGEPVLDPIDQGNRVGPERRDGLLGLLGFLAGLQRVCAVRENRTGLVPQDGALASVTPFSGDPRPISRSLPSRR
jgi:hypothetical protein